MPLYEMHCPDETCGYRGEHLSRTTRPRIVCPSCAKTRLVKSPVQAFSVGKSSSNSGESEEPRGRCRKGSSPEKCLGRAMLSQGFLPGSEIHTKRERGQVTELEITHPKYDCSVDGFSINLML